MFSLKSKYIALALILISCFAISSKNLVLAENQEVINNFQVTANIDENSTVSIQEIITYNFGTNQKHGIIRFIPNKYPLEGKTLFLDIVVLGVNDEAGQTLPYTAYQEGNNLVIKIGSPDVLITGQKIYVINYQVKAGLNYFTDHDELYWNVTGNDWSVPIERASFNLAFSQALAFLTSKDIQTTCYTGSLGSKASNCIISPSTPEMITFSIANLKPNEGLTIVAGWPKGLVKEQSKHYFQSSSNNPTLIFLSILISIVIITFIILFRMWWKIGRNPRKTKVIIPEYEPPQGLIPAEASLILTEGIFNTDKITTATIIDLARRGYFIIKETSTQIFFENVSDWTFIKTNPQPANDQLNDYEKYLLGIIFEEGDTIKLSQLNKPLDYSDFQTRKKALDSAMKSLTQGLITKQLMPHNPYDLTRKLDKWKSATSIIFLFSFILGISFFNDLLMILFVPLLFSYILRALFSIFGHFMPSLTEKGLQLKEKLLGFKLFLKTVEKDRVKFHFSPEAHPEKFAEYLPYAILFGLERQWAKLFMNIDAAVPNWYQNPAGTHLNSWYLVYGISNMTSGLKSSGLSSFSRVSGGGFSSGVSGFGGGGFSGGGGGGGGGSSW